MEWLPTSQLFAGVSFALVVVIAFSAAVFRNRFYAYFITVLLALHVVITVGLYSQVGPLAWLMIYLQLATVAHFGGLVWAKMRPGWWRLLISVPAHVFVGGTYLAFPWAITAAFGWEMPGWWAPYAIALTGLLESYWFRGGVVDLVVGDGAGRVETTLPVRSKSGAQGEGRPLRLVQITDPHLGPWMSVARLRRVCERAVAKEPDLILLTGDFLTMESQEDPKHLTAALAPLKEMAPRVFACLGNHDHEALDTVRSALRHNDIKLLVDDEAIASTPVGEVQVVGFDYAWTRRKEAMAEVCERCPRRPGMLRLLLLHDPGAFKHLPRGEGDLVLSGHTHGGQLGLVSLGAAWTVVWAFAKIPDHGLFIRGSDRLYVHRGTGHYGFPLRLGVPAEESLLRVWTLTG